MPLLNTLANTTYTSQIDITTHQKFFLITSEHCTYTTKRPFVILLGLTFLKNIDIPCSIIKEHSHHTLVYSSYSYQMDLIIKFKGLLYTNQIALLHRQKPFIPTEISSAHLIPPNTYQSNWTTNLRGTSVPTSEYPIYTHSNTSLYNWESPSCSEQFPLYLRGPSIHISEIFPTNLIEIFPHISENCQ